MPLKNEKYYGQKECLKDVRDSRPVDIKYNWQSSFSFCFDYQK